MKTSTNCEGFPRKMLTGGKVLKKFGKLSNKKKIEVLWTALAFMQQYNGRLKVECVCLAMGYEFLEDEGG